MIYDIKSLVLELILIIKKSKILKICHNQSKIGQTKNLNFS